MSKDPLNVIESLPPQFSDADAERVARQYYAMQATVQRLVGERDQNFLLSAPDGSRWVLKIANAAEDPQFTKFQIRALKHIAAKSDEVSVPLLRRTVDGQDYLTLERSGQAHIARLVSWIDGKPLAGTPLTADLCRRLGICLARLGQQLEDFDFPAGRQALLWDMRHALSLRKVLPLIADGDTRSTVADCLDDFAEHALPRFTALRTQVIHNDFNPDNVIVRPQEPAEVAGIIDFGDLQVAPLIVDVAIGASYLRNVDGDPLTHIADFIAGYHSQTALRSDEVSLLYDLISTRLAATVAILAWRQSARQADDAYLYKAAAGESGAAPFLQRFRALPRADVARRLRQVCASAAMRPA